MPKIIALMPVRNEAWILDRNLQALSTFCNHIIVADQRSTDGTGALLERFAPKVSVIYNSNPCHSDSIRWTLLEVARQYDGNNLLLYMDADEIPSANILVDNTLDHLISLPPGTSFLGELVNLWRSPALWRKDDSQWSGRWMEIGFRDDRLVKYGPMINAIHIGRIPLCREIIRFHKLKLLHFQFVLFERMRSKQCWYRVLEVMEYGGLSRDNEINCYYQVTRDERRMHLEPAPAEWTAGWKARGIDLENFEEAPLYWYDVEVLRYFREKGAAYFAPIDIWDIDWEAKRRIAQAEGYEDIPDEEIRDPRTMEQRFYHAYLHRFFRTPPWRDPRELIRIPERGARGLVRSLGLRRSHLEQLGLLKPREDEEGDVRNY